MLWDQTSQIIILSAEINWYNKAEIITFLTLINLLDIHWSMNSCRMNSVLILVFNILASSLAEPDPDQHIHVHLQPEDSKGGLTHDILMDHVSSLGGQSPKAAGGVLVPEDGKGGLTHDILMDHVSFLGGEAPKTGGGHLADYGGWTPKRCHPHCMPNCHSWCVPPKKTWEAAGGVADYGSWTHKKCHPHPELRNNPIRTP